MKHESTSGLHPEILSRLLALGIEKAQRSGRARGVPDQKKLPRGSRTAETAEAILARPCPGVAGAADRPLGRVILDANTDVGVLKAIKEYAKRCASTRGPEHVCYLTIYYAALAAALVFHEQKITRLSYARLAEGFADLTARRWVPEELRDLFEKAQAVSRSTALRQDLQVG